MYTDDSSRERRIRPRGRSAAPARCGPARSQRLLVLVLVGWALATFVAVADPTGSAQAAGETLRQAERSTETATNAHRAPGVRTGWRDWRIWKLFRTGPARLREKGRQLAARFKKETRSEEALRDGEVLAAIDEQPRAVGDVEHFKIDKTDAGQKLPISATLRAIGRHCLVYVEQGQKVDDAKIRRIVEGFDRRIYPVTTAWFGSEWKPGIDGDPRITLLLVGGLEGMDGCFDPEDEYTRKKCPDSNEREMLYLSIERLGDVDDFLGHLVAHEFQHMIHWNHDPREANWVDEGCAEFAATLHGIVPFTIESWLEAPHRCLLDWSDSQGAANYGHSFAFMNYLAHQVAPSVPARQQLMRAIVANRRTSVAGVEEALRETRNVMGFNEWFRGFSAATFLNRATDDLSGTFAYDRLLATQLASSTLNPLAPARRFTGASGKVKGRCKPWATLGYEFRVGCDARPAALEVKFTGSVVEGQRGRNSFDVAVCFTDQTRVAAPHVAWLRLSSNAGQGVFTVPAGYDRALVLVVNRGPIKLPANEKRWPAVPFSLTVTPAVGVDAARDRFEALHRQP